MESQEMEKKLNKEEYNKWTEFRSVQNNKITNKNKSL